MTTTTNTADTRKAELLADYPDGYVSEPGQFEGESIATIYFYELMLDGGADELVPVGPDAYVDVFAIDADDRARWELADTTTHVMLEISEQGFVSLTELTDRDYQRLVDDSTEAAGPQEDDLTTEDHRTFYKFGHCVLESVTDDTGDWWRYRATSRGPWMPLCQGVDDQQAVQIYMDKTQYWPNVWFISDHGNAHLVRF